MFLKSDFVDPTEEKANRCTVKGYRKSALNRISSELKADLNRISILDV
jgi:hypothetical protein